AATALRGFAVDERPLAADDDTQRPRRPAAELNCEPSSRRDRQSIVAADVILAVMGTGREIARRNFVRRFSAAELRPAEARLGACLPGTSAQKVSLPKSAGTMSADGNTAAEQISLPPFRVRCHSKTRSTHFLRPPFARRSATHHSKRAVANELPRTSVLTRRRPPQPFGGLMDSKSQHALAVRV